MKVTVIGAGISGLATAYRLLEAGAAPVLVEAEGRVGGKIFSEAADGFLLGELDQRSLSGGELVPSLESSGGREGPAGSALSLVLDWLHILSPVDGRGGHGLSGVDWGSSLNVWVDGSHSLEHFSLSLVREDGHSEFGVWVEGLEFSSSLHVGLEDASSEVEFANGVVVLSVERNE